MLIITKTDSVEFMGDQIKAVILNRYESISEDAFKNCQELLSEKKLSSISFGSADVIGDGFDVLSPSTHSLNDEAYVFEFVDPNECWDIVKFKLSGTEAVNEIQSIFRVASSPSVLSK